MAKNYIKLSLAFFFLAFMVTGDADAQDVLNQDRPKPMPESKRCIKKTLGESVEIQIRGHFRTEYGCYFAGVYVNSQYLKKDDAGLSKIVLGALGWEKASQAEREKLAKLWVEKGLLAYSRVLYAKDEDFGNGEFKPPHAMSEENGEIKVTLWILKPSGMMKRAKNIHQLEFKFASDGNMSGESPL